MSFTGMFNTSNFTTDLAKKSFAGMIMRLMPNGSAPLFGLTSMLKSETAVQVEHGYFAKTMLFPELKINDAANIAAGVTVLTVDSSTNVLPGMVMRVNRTGEHVLINQVVSSTVVQVTRGVGVTAAAQINDDDNLYQVGNAFEEGSDRPTALNITPERITNLTQIFRNTWALTDIARATQVIAGETNVAESKQDCAAFHAADIEKSLFFGQKSQGTRNGKPFRTMDGLISIVEQYTAQDNVHTAAATTNYTQLEDMLDPVFNQATDPKVANERLLFVGGSAKRVLNNIGRLNGTYQLVDGATSFGLQFTTFKTARGTFRVIEHPLFNTNTNWAKMAVGIDLSTFNVAYLGDRKTKSEEFGQEDGGDSVGGSLTTEMTCLVKNPPANVVIYGLTAAAAG